MQKITFKIKVYILYAIIGMLFLIVDIFNIIELNRYNGLMAILVLTILFSGIQYRAALKGLDTMLSINRDYKVRKLWNIENQFDWKTVRKKQMTWAPILMGISLIQLLILYLTYDTYSVVLIILWAINTLSYVIFTRPIKSKSI
ncbi:hypothetical protein AX762_04340 [Alkalibacterium sp. 20]|nr:hypothetical protein AX762_04340 [Alkalibacterium sp. 20]